MHAVFSLASRGSAEYNASLDFQHLTQEVHSPRQADKNTTDHLTSRCWVTDSWVAQWEKPGETCEVETNFWKTNKNEVWLKRQRMQWHDGSLGWD